MTTVFKQSISRFGSILTPDKIIITNNMFTWEKRNKNLINKDVKSFEIAKITSVEIDSAIWGTKIKISTIAGDVITVSKFTLSDAKKIKQLIEKNRNNKKDFPVSNSKISTVSDILKLKELLDKGLITEKEFLKLKQSTK